MSLWALSTRTDHRIDTGVICQFDGPRGGETHAVRTEPQLIQQPLGVLMD